MSFPAKIVVFDAFSESEGQRLGALATRIDDECALRSVALLRKWKAGESRPRYQGMSDKSEWNRAFLEFCAFVAFWQRRIFCFSEE